MNKDKMVNIENGRLQISLDKRTESLIRRVDRRNNIVPLNGDENNQNMADRFRVMIPKKRWHSCYADNNQADPPQFIEQPDGLILQYKT